ncbi:MAG: DNA repair protein RecO [Pyrinomonadaceae bacterium]|nr:DNA repair protein RecO [Pyrinomonadaceae bacterium]
MGLVETEALVLRTYNLSDADKIVVSLTEKQGLVRGVAKGAKRLKSKFGGSLEPFSIVNITYFQKEEMELVSIRDIELRKSYFSDASKPEFLQKFSYLADLLTKFAPPHDPNERLYNMSRICLETGAVELESLDIIALYFEYWILKLGGYLPGWKHCSKCAKEFGNAETADLQLDFNLTCASCSAGRSVERIGPAERRVFNEAQNMPPGKFIVFVAKSRTEVTSVSGILKQIISRVIDREFVGETSLTA